MVQYHGLFSKMVYGWIYPRTHFQAQFLYRARLLINLVGVCPILICQVIDYQENYLNVGTNGNGYEFKLLGWFNTIVYFQKWYMVGSLQEHIFRLNFFIVQDY